MTFDNSLEEPPSITRGSYPRLKALWHRLTVRFILLLGVAVFLTAVAVDSLQQASAAAISTERLSLELTATPVKLNHQAPRQQAQRPATAKSYRNFDAETAKRLGHSDLTSASLTRSRLTSSHLFTSPVR